MHTMEDLNKIVNSCRKCELYQGRAKSVFGQGNQNAVIMFIGEGPGYHEDQQGLAFVGPAGQLLTKAIEGIGLKRDDVYIANMVKCRPPNNRNPLKEEIQACITYLRWQVKLIEPQIIVCLGSISATSIIDGDLKITRDRGKWFLRKGVWIMPTYHPSAVLRDELKKKPFWEDFKELKRKYNEININVKG